MTVRHFLSLLDLSSEELRGIIAHASELKRDLHKDQSQPLRGRALGMIFDKSSTRTRVSFEVGMTQMGGHALFLSPRDTQLGRGEPVEDTARVLSRMVDVMLIRTFSHEQIQSFAANSRVPVINGLTDLFHPCQLLADMQTFFEHRGDIQGRTVAWIGDGNNMCNSYINAARQFDFNLRIACPEGYEPDQELLAAADNRVQVTRDSREAVEDVDLVVTDVWASMGQEEEQAKRVRAFSSYQVDDKLLGDAHKDAVFMHCLPAHRGEEVTSQVLEGASSVVWDEAENRLHAQKALILFLLGKAPKG